MIVVVMGVAGSGKTTVGQQLAAYLGWRFVEGDDFHPAANVAKMARGQPLTDGRSRSLATSLATGAGAIARSR
jgi:gluconokinase